MAFAQNKNPFQTIGKKGKILSLSGGKYDENFDKDSLERIGTVIVNRCTRRIEKLLTENAGNKEQHDVEQSRFLSVDPLASTFPEYSPYQYAGNTPIQAIDLDGLEEFVVAKELFRSGSVKKITVQYTITKDDSKQLVNAHFRAVLGKNSDGTDRLGEYLTDRKVIRITIDANGRETALPDDKLTPQEQAIVDKRSKNEPTNPTQDQWQLTIGKKLYSSETERNSDKTTDKAAEKGFPGNAPMFNGTPLQPGSVLGSFNGSNNYFYGGAPLPNGGQLGNDLTTSLNSLADQLKKADNVKSVTLNLNQGINAPAGSQEYNTANQYGAAALGNAVSLLRARLKGTNIAVNLGTVNTSPNATNADLLRKGAPSGVNATIQ